MNQARAWRRIASILAFLVIGGMARAQQDARTDRHGDPLPAGVIARLGTVRLHFGGGVESVAVSPDGSILIAGGRVCDGKTGKELPQFTGKHLAGTALFSDDIMTVSIGKSNGIERWELATGKLIEKNHWKEKWDPSDWATFTPDLKLIAFASFGHLDPGAKVMETATRKTLLELKDGGRVVLSPDGKNLAAFGMDGKVVVWDVVAKKEVRRWKAHERIPGQLYQFSPDSKTLASSVSRREIRFWEVATGKLISEIKDAGGRNLVFSPDGKSIAYDDCDAIRMRDVGTGKETGRFIGHGGCLIWAMSFSANGKYLVSGARDHTVILWDVTSGKAMHDFVGHRGPVASLAFSPKGDFLASGGGEDHAVIVWDLANHQPRHTLPDHEYSVNCLAFSPDGKIIASGDGSIGSADREAHIRLWNADKGTLVRKFFAHPDAVTGLVFLKDGKRLASTGGGGRTRIWAVATGERLHQIRQGGFLSSLPDGHTLLMTGRRLTTWDTQTWQKKTDLDFGQENASLIALRDDKTVLLIASKPGRMGLPVMEVQYRDIESGNPKRSFVLGQISSHQSCAIALSPDETILAVCSFEMRDPTVHLYDTENGELMANLRGHTSYTQCLAFSPDGKMLASTGWDSTVLLWDVQRVRLARQWRELGLGIAESDRAAETLIANPQGVVAFLRDHLRRAAALEKPYARLIADLGSGRFETRDQAMKHLTLVGPAAEFALGMHLEMSSDIEQRRRAKVLLENAAAVRQDTIERLMVQLDGDGAPAAFLQLVALGAAAEPKIREILTKPFDRRKMLSPRMRFYLQQAIDRLKEPSNHATEINPAQALRAASIVEAIGTPEATQVIRELADGPAESNLTRQAALALKRLAASTKKTKEANP